MAADADILKIKKYPNRRYYDITRSCHLTLDDIYGSGGGRFYGSAAARLTFLDNPWVDDAHYLWPGDNPSTPTRPGSRGPRTRSG